MLAKWILKLAYLSDISTKISKLNGLWSDCDWANREVDGFHRRAEIVEEGNGRNLLLENENIGFPDIRNVMEHLERLTLDFECYLPEDLMEYSWVTVMWKI